MRQLLAVTVYREIISPTLFGTFQLDDYVSVGLVSVLYHDITLDGI